MRNRDWSRRDVLKTSAALAASALFAEPARAAAPPPTGVTPALVEAARKEGKLSYYCALELNVGERLARTFEAKYPGIAVRVERSGAERIFQRIAQEQSSRIYAVDVANSTDPAHYLDWRSHDWLAPHVPEDVAKHYPAEHRDPEGLHATVCAWLSVIGYNTDLVKREDAPKSFADLLDPRWKGKIVKGHPGYSGAILTDTFQIARDLGWSYFEKLAQQKVMQVQSALDPPHKLALGESAVQADGAGSNLLLLKERGAPVEAVYATEGTPVASAPSGVFQSAPNPNAARLFQSYLFSAEAQQILVGASAMCSLHALVQEKPGRRPLSTIKLMKSDPAAMEAQREEIKARYRKIFGAL